MEMRNCGLSLYMQEKTTRTHKLLWPSLDFSVLWYALQLLICSIFHCLRLLSYATCQASTEVGAAKVYELLQGKTFRSVGWSTLFDCLSIYEEKFKKSIQSSANILPDFPEGDAQALVAYLAVLQKV